MKKRIDIISEKRGSSLFIIGIILIFILIISIGLISLVKANSQSQQEELASLEQNLTGSGYGWLINQNVINGGNI